MKVKAVIFDFDGVIHNTFELAYRIHTQIHPGNTKEDFRSYFDRNLFMKIDKILDRKSQDRFRELEFEAFKNLKVEREIKEELEKLNEKYDLHIISSNSNRNLKIYFENNGFTNIFREILTAEVHKSKVEKFRILFKKYNLNPCSCVFVTDTLGDVLEANKVGVKTIAVDFGFHERERLEKGNPFKIVSDFKDIRKIIESM